MSYELWMMSYGLSAPLLSSALSIALNVKLPNYFRGMVHIYGIKNCDTVQKAIKLLDRKVMPYVFHDYKAEGLNKATIEAWLKHLPLDKLVNSRSTTFRELAEADRAKAKDREKAIALMMEYPSIIKRPVWDFGNGDLLLGWDEAELEKRL